MKRKKSSRNTVSVEDGTSKNLSELHHNDLLPLDRPKYICAICKKSFSDKNCLKKHIQKIHDVEPGPFLESK